MAPSLTTGCINKILNGEDVPNPVIQILNYKKSCTDRYLLLISDGVTGYPFVTMDTDDLKEMVERREMQKFIVVRVDDYFCQSVPNDHTIIVLRELTVLAPGNEINKKLGNPVNVTRNSSTTTPLKTEANEAIYTSPKPLFEPDKSFMTEPEAGTISDAEMIKFLNLESYTMVPSLSTGSINKILNGEGVSNPVIQILNYKKCPCTEQKYERYRLLISDGVTGYSFATLGTQLNHMVVNKELDKFTVIRVDKYVCNQVQNNRKVIFLLNLTVLVPGDEINRTLGNPLSPNVVPSTVTPSENEINGIVHTSVSARS